MKKTIVILGIIGLLFLGFTLISKKKDSLETLPTAFVQTHSIEKNKQATLSDNFEYFQAKIEALQNPKIATKISGYITDIKVNENQIVKKGDILATIDQAEYRKSIEQLQFSLQAINTTIESLQLSLESLELDSALAKTQYITNKKLYEVGGISKEKLDLSQIQYKQKESKYLTTVQNIQAKEYEKQSFIASIEAKNKLSVYYILKSPIDAKVEKILLDIGDLTNPNQSILTLLSNTNKLTFSFASKDIKPFQDVYIEDKKIGYIKFISPSSENFLQVANIKLTQLIQQPNNSLISIKVKIK